MKSVVLLAMLTAACAVGTYGRDPGGGGGDAGAADAKAKPDASSAPSNPPPQDQCGHSLCSTGDFLDEGCDSPGCTIVICDPGYLGDVYCCDQGWDQQCIDEVDELCAPYSCD